MSSSTAPKSPPVTPRRRAGDLVRGLSAAIAPLPPYRLGSIVALGLLCAIEVAALPGPRTVSQAVALTGLVIGLGTLHGWLWQVGLAGLGRLRRGLAWTVIAAGALAGAYWLADAMGAVARLDSRYDTLARAVLAVSAVGALSFAVLVALLRPTPAAPRGRLAAFGRGLTTGIVVSLVTLAGGLAYVDHTLYVGLYPEAHLALRVGTTWALTFAFGIGARALHPPTLDRRGWLAFAIVVTLPLAVLRDDRLDSIQALVARPWSATLLRVARGILDLDRDGHSALLAGGDCNDFDPRVHPTAREIRGNGVDDNCAFGDARAVATDPAEVPTPTEPSPMNVLLVSVDCLRWDRIALNHPAGRRATPKLSKWAKRAVNFRRAYTAGAWTSIAVGSMMRGMYARRLEWTAYYETSFYRLLRDPARTKLGKKERVAKMFPVAWRDPRWALPQWLQRRGMTTLAVVNDGFSQMLSKSLEVDRGFEIFREISGEPAGDPDAFMRARRRYRSARSRHDDSATATAAISAIRWSARGKNFFGWVHFFGPHTPSTAHEDGPDFGDSVEDDYDEEVRYLDEHLDRLLQAVDELDMPTAVFVTADHGEHFYGQYRSHGADLSEDVLRVPLLARVPGWTPKNVDAPVSLVDLVPTILALTRTPAPPDLDGIDLARTLPGKAPARRTMFADTWHYDRHGRAQKDLVTAFDGRHKVVLDRLTRGLLGYDQADPRSQPLRLEAFAADRLVRAAEGYLEESGGTLELER